MAINKLSAIGFFEKHRDKVNIAGADDCWLWTGGKSRDGYGMVSVNGKMRRAHREAYEAANGDDSASALVVRHRCDVRACVNPAHLEIGTAADNLRDMMERGRQSRPMGEAHGRAKLTDTDVLAIRALYVSRSRDHNLRAIGRQFGITPQTVRAIVRHERWAHVGTDNANPLNQAARQKSFLLTREVVEKLDKLAVVYGSKTRAVAALILAADGLGTTDV